MGGLMGGNSNAGTVTKYTGINLQTSALGLCIPVGWGLARWSINLLWYNDFQANPSGKGKGGKGGSSKSGSYTYTAAVILGLGEGPVSGLGTIWADQGTSTLGSLNLGLATGGADQTAPSYIEDNYPDQALDYAYTAYLFSALYSLGSSAELPSINVEVQSKFYNSQPYTFDANMADIVNDFITNEQYGLDSGTTYVDAPSLSLFHTYCEAQQLFFSPYCNQQEQGTSMLQRWSQLSNTWIFWSGTKLKFVPLGDGVVESNGITYSPNIQPILDIGLDDYQRKNNEPGITVTRSDPRDGYNHVELHIKERSQQYVDFPIYWDDQTSVDLYGQLQSQIISASEICDKTIGARVAALIGKRSVYVRNTYEFKIDDSLGDLFEPGDIVTVTSPFIGLEQFPVRIQTITENDDQAVTIVAEEFPEGIGQATLYDQQAGGGSGVPDPNIDPGNVNQPMFLEPPLNETGNTAQIWVGISGGTNWGGAYVFISSDGTNYVNIGPINLGTVQGTLTAALASHADPDTTDTLSVNVAECNGIISTAATEQMADDFQTPALIDQEIICYGTVTLTGANAYNLTYLRRGTYGTVPAAHSSGAQFAVINPAATLKYNLPTQYIGVELYFKFTSFNVLGGGLQDISDVPVWTYTPEGSAYNVNPPTGLAAAATSGPSVTLSWTNPNNPVIDEYIIFRAAGLAAPFSSATQIATTPAPATGYQDLSVQPNTAYTYYIEAASAVKTSTQSNAASVTTSASGGTLLPLVNGNTPVGIITDSSGVPVYVLQ